MRLVILCGVLLSLTSCANVRDNLGLDRSAPDEFKVVTNAPLEMPPSLSELPPPRPGLSRPQESAISQQAKTTLLGAGRTDASRSEAESILLDKVGVENSQSDIRGVIDSEYNADDTSNQSVTQRLLGIGGSIREDQSVIDPEAELKRLEKLRPNE